MFGMAPCMVGAGGGNPFEVDLYNTVNDGDRVISCADAAPINITGDLTYEFWYRATVLPPAASLEGFCSKNNNLSQSDAWYSYLLLSGSDHLWKFKVGDGSSWGRVYVTVSLVVDTWYHFAMSLDISQAQADQCKFYLDGVDQGAVTIQNAYAATSIGTATYPLVWGSLRNSSDSINGKMTEMRLWSKIRTESEINADMNKSIDPSSANLECYIQNV